MKVTVVAVGKARAPLAEAIAEYERRVARYFAFEAIEVREASSRSQPLERSVQLEGERLLARLPERTELVALHRAGEPWSSEGLADHLAQHALLGQAGLTFLLGGAYGLDRAVLERADRLLSLSSMTLPHELARLLLTEQLYRAGTIARGEPYHKAPRR